MAARVSVAPIVHEGEDLVVYQAYAGDSEGVDVSFLGYAGTGSDVISAVPGVLSIIPGTNWVNFVGAANANSLGGVWSVNGLSYTIKNVVLTKKTPAFIQCSEVYAPKTITQQGTPNIRTWWPLMYEAPGTVWTLTVLYGTPQLRVNGVIFDYDDDGILGSNPASPVHQEIWKWKLDVTFDSLSSLLALFHELPFGLDEVPLISNDALYAWLQAQLAGVVALAPYDTAGASLLLGEFELEVQDNAISASPLLPSPSVGTGIAQTAENPAACKILVDVEYLAAKYGIFAAAK
jgi:hypothetical protein